MRIGYNRNANGDRYAAVIIAGGLSSRMGELKPLLYVDGRPALAGLAETMRGAGVEDVIVVTGHMREKLLPLISELRIEDVFNEDYEDGMFSSLKKGLAKAKKLWPEKEGYLMVPVDCPIISIDTVRAVINAYQEGKAGGGENGGAGAAAGGRFTVPAFEGKKGHPLLIPGELIDEIMDCSDKDGIKTVTYRHRKDMIKVPVNDEGCVMDMDTPEDHEEIKKFVSAGFRREKLAVTTARRRIIMVRHGETEAHDGPVFIGQYDVKLSEEGHEQAKAAAAKIADIVGEDVERSCGWIEGVSIGQEPMPPIENIYCSDLARAKETADHISKELNARFGGSGYRTRVIEKKGLREVALGHWDGRSVEEIKREFPEEYMERGEDIFGFKAGSGWESFFDMQYRVMKTLREIMAGDDGRNIVIVAHSGVIRALENNLKGMRVDDEWDILEKGDIRIWEAPAVV